MQYIQGAKKLLFLCEIFIFEHPVPHARMPACDLLFENAAESEAESAAGILGPYAASFGLVQKSELRTRIIKCLSCFDSWRIYFIFRSFQN